MRKWKPVSQRTEIIMRLVGLAGWLLWSWLFGQWISFLIVGLVTDWWFRRAARKSREQTNSM
jgi:hypothetical protein